MTPFQVAAKNVIAEIEEKCGEYLEMRPNNRAEFLVSLLSQKVVSMSEHIEYLKMMLKCERDRIRNFKGEV
jgi:hypothetical protein